MRFVRFLVEVVVFLGALACVLQFLEIRPTDLAALGWPHWAWLLSAVILFGGGIFMSLRSLNLAKRVYRASQEGHYLLVHPPQSVLESFPGRMAATLSFAEYVGIVDQLRKQHPEMTMEQISDLTRHVACTHPNFKQRDSWWRNVLR